MAEFRVAMPAGATPAEVSDDILVQLGPRAFSTRQEPDGLYISGGVSEAEATTVLSGFAARKATRVQQAAADAAADTSDRTAVVQANPIPALQGYIDTPNASITPGQTYTTVKLLCRVAIWLIRRELKRTL